MAQIIQRHPALRFILKTLFYFVVLLLLIYLYVIMEQAKSHLSTTNSNAEEIDNI